MMLQRKDNRARARISFTVCGLILAGLVFVQNSSLFDSQLTAGFISILQILPIILVARHPTAAIVVLCAGLAITSMVGAGIRVPWSAGSVLIGVVVIASSAVRSSDVRAFAHIAALSTTGLIAVAKHDMPVMGYALGVFAALGTTVMFRLVGRVREASARLLVEHEKRLAEEVRRSAEARRSALSSEVHDVVGHYLSLISLTALAEQGVRSTLQQKDFALTEIASCASLALAEIRSILNSSDYSPGECCRESSEPDSILQLVAEWCAVGVSITYEGLELIETADTNLQKEAYLVARQAITNAVQHGSENTVRVTVYESGRSLKMSIMNPTDKGAVEAGRGISGIRSRLESSGHTLSVTVNEGLFELRASFTRTTGL